MKVLLCISGIGRGHAARCLPLIQSLQDRGHQCSAAVPGRRAAEMLDGTCEILTPERGQPQRDRKVSGRPLYLSIRDLSDVFDAYQADPLAGLVETLRFADEAIDSTKPDLVVVDQILGVAQLVRSRGIPVAQMTNAPLLPGFGSWTPWSDPSDESPERSTRAQELLEQAFGTLGVQATTTLDDQLDGELIAINALADFGTCSGALHLSIPDSLGYPTLDLPPETSTPRILIYLSQAGEALLGPVVDGVSRSGFQPVVVDRRPDDPSPSLSRPDVMASGPVDLPSALAGSAAIIHQGGIATAGAALEAGTPQIAIPRNSEQEGNIRTVERLGAGIHLPVSEQPQEPIELSHGYAVLGHKHPDRLAERLSDVLGTLTSSDTFRDGAVAAGEKQRKLPGLDTLVDQMESLV